MRYTLLFSLLLITLLFSCSSSDPAPANSNTQSQTATPTPASSTKSTDKQIISFSFSQLTPAAIGVINSTDKTVNLLVPGGTVVSALIPTITISEKASIAPASGVAQNFSSPVTYEVTAEDGSKQTYSASVSFSQNFTLDPFIGFSEFEQGDYFLIKGSGFGTDASKIKVTLINKNTAVTTDVTTFVVTNNTSVGFFIPDTLPLGDYSVKLTIGETEKTLPETFTIVIHTPKINLVNKTTIEQGQNLVITGEYFNSTGNTVALTKSGSAETLTIVTESTTSIEVTVPASTPVGTYTIGVTANGKTGFYTSSITVTIPSTAPVITSINGSTFARGATMVITGLNLKKSGAISNINFIPFISGSTVVRSAIPNSDGTELSYTIPMDFPLGSYLIVVEVDFEYSEEYGDVIPITN